MSSLQQRLQTALGRAYTIERELGGGGMAHVFLAREEALGRNVVVKVLPPEMAPTVDAERFRREIQLLASLQHPLIVPVLSAGAADGLLYYTMPFIEGESLRARIAAQGALPGADAMRILRDVADALAYAHERGVVHRDIKPANILLSGHHALVADFGVAKAVSAASADTTLTSAGLALGTPAYMAPEQALAESVDHRADLYAAGVVGYEMLCGTPPFSGMTAQQMLVAQATRAPEPIAARRRDVPAALGALIMRCLAKNPDERVQSAKGLLAALDTTAAPGALARGVRPGRRRIAVIAVAAAVVVVGAWFGMRALGVGPLGTLRARGTIRARQPVVLADFTNHSSDSTLGAALTEAFRVDLSQSPTVRLVSTQAVSDALVRMERPASTALTPAVARAVAQREGISAVVQGEIAQAGRGYLLAASVVSPADGSVLTAVRETAASDAELLPALDRLSRALRTRVGESLASIRTTPTLERVTTPSLDALRKYTRALQLDAVSDYEGAIPLLQQATALDTGFAMAWRKLADRLSMVGGSNDRIIAAATHAYEHRDRLPELERDLTTATYFELVDFDLPRAIAADQAALELDSSNNLALANAGQWLERQRRYAAAESLSARGMRLGQRGVIFANLVRERALLGRYAGADSAIRQVDAESPQAPLVLALSGILSASRHDFPLAIRQEEELRARQAASPVWQERTNLTLATIAALQGQIAQSATSYLRSAGGESVPPQNRLAAAIRVAWLDLRYRNGVRAARARVDSAVARYPLASLAPVDRPYSLLALFYAEAGRAAEAKRLLAEFERTMPEGQRRADTLYYGARGAIALAEGRTQEAISDFRAWYDSSGCENCALFELATAFQLAGEPDSALAAYQRLVALPGMFRIFGDAFTLPLAYQRLGELYEARGDRANAVAYYTRFADLWKDADRDLQPGVRDARARVARLTSAERR